MFHRSISEQFELSGENNFHLRLSEQEQNYFYLITYFLNFIFITIFIYLKMYLLLINKTDVLNNVNTSLVFELISKIYL